MEMGRSNWEKRKKRWWHGRKGGDSRAVSFGEMWGILQHGKISKATRTCGSQNFPFSDVAFSFSITSLNTPTLSNSPTFSPPRPNSQPTLSHQNDQNDDPQHRQHHSCCYPDTHTERKTRSWNRVSQIQSQRQAENVGVKRLGDKAVREDDSLATEAENLC